MTTMGLRTRRPKKKKRKRKKNHHSCLSLLLLLLVLVLTLTLWNIHVVMIQSDLSDARSSSSSFLLWPSSTTTTRKKNAAAVVLQNKDLCFTTATTPQNNNHNNNTNINSSSALPPTGLVVTLLLGGEKNPQLLNSVCSLFSSQLTHFIVPHELDVLFVVSGNIYEQTLVDCLDLRIYNNNNINNTITTWTNLDSSTLTTRHYQVVTAIAGIPYMTQVFVASEQPSLPLPLYIQRNESILKEPIQPPMCQAPFEYIQGTRWYTNEFLHLAILQQNYEYWIKLDPDVVFLRPLEINLLQDMKRKGAVFGHTAEYPEGFQTPCSEGIRQATTEFLLHHNVCAVPETPLPDTDRYYTNFIVGRTDFFQSAPVRQLARWLSEYPHGFFEHRWTDQIFYAVALTLYLHSTDTNTNSNSNSPPTDSAIVDFTDFRCFPVKGCWMSSLELKKYAHLDVCENGGFFVHSKHARRWVHQWNRHLARTEPYQLDTQLPYKTNYRHDCRGTRWSAS